MECETSDAKNRSHTHTDARRAPTQRNCEHKFKCVMRYETDFFFTVEHLPGTKHISIIQREKKIIHKAERFFGWLCQKSVPFTLSFTRAVDVDVMMEQCEAAIRCMWFIAIKAM